MFSGRVYFDMKQILRGFLSKVWILEFYLEHMRIFPMKLFSASS